MLERLSWKKWFFEGMCCLLIALLLGVIWGHLPWFLFTTVLILLCWHGYNQLRLSHCLWSGRRILSPVGRGSWEPLFYGLYQMQQRNRRRRRELALLIKLFRSGAESLPDAVVITMEDGTIFWCNKLAQHVLGLRWPDDKGQNILNLLRYPEFSSWIKQKNHTEAFTLTLNNGSMLEFRMMPYSDHQNMIVARDVTQMRQLEQSRHLFFTNASHELRTPLTVLQGYLEMMGDADIPQPLRDKALVTMQEQTYRMESLVNQLLTLSRIEASAFDVDLRTFVAMPSILRILEQESRLLSYDHHQLDFQVDTTLNVYGNEEQLRSAVSNLVYNAIYHTPKGTHISVRWWREAKGGAGFSVVDNGPGIASEHLSRLTERFYRVDKARSRQTGGSGLGLAIVKHALQHHETALQIHSEVGKGTTFSFALPERRIVKEK